MLKEHGRVIRSYGTWLRASGATNNCERQVGSRRGERVSHSMASNEDDGASEEEASFGAEVGILKAPKSQEIPRSNPTNLGDQIARVDEDRNSRVIRVDHTQIREANIGKVIEISHIPRLTSSIADLDSITKIGGGAYNGCLVGSIVPWNGPGPCEGLSDNKVITLVGNSSYKWKKEARSKIGAGPYNAASKGRMKTKRSKVVEIAQVKTGSVSLVQSRKGTNKIVMKTAMQMGKAEVGG